MSTAARRQREIAERERLFLSIARKLFVERGYLGLNMDRIAEESEYSKGTVYGHFGSKEDLVAALCTDTVRVRSEYFRRATAFKGRPRERLLAVGISDQILVRLHPDHFATEHVLNISSVFDRLTEPRREAFLAEKAKLMAPIMDVIHEAIEVGDLKFSDGESPCTVMYALWTQSVGHHAIAAQPMVPPFQEVSPDAALWINYQRVLDGYGFLPLSTETDYHASLERILSEAFPEERHVLTGFWAGRG